MHPTKKVIFVAVVLIAIFSILAYGIGFENGVSLTINQALKVLPHFVSVNISYEAINDALFQYENRISGCGVPKL